MAESIYGDPGISRTHRDGPITEKHATLAVSEAIRLLSQNTPRKEIKLGVPKGLVARIKLKKPDNPLDSWIPWSELNPEDSKRFGFADECFQNYSDKVTNANKHGRGIKISAEGILTFTQIYKNSHYMFFKENPEFDENDFYLCARAEMFKLDALTRTFPEAGDKSINSLREITGTILNVLGESITNTYYQKHPPTAE